VLSLDVRDESAVGRAAPFVDPTFRAFSRGPDAFHDGRLTARDSRHEDQESANRRFSSRRSASDSNFSPGEKELFGERRD
jgi:hypothetical protein